MLRRTLDRARSLPPWSLARWSLGKPAPTRRRIAPRLETNRLRAPTSHRLLARRRPKARGTFVVSSRLYEGAVDFDCHASVQQVDRDHEQALGEVGANEETLDAGQRAARHPDPLACGQERMRQNGQVGAKRLLDCGEVRIRYH